MTLNSLHIMDLLFQSAELVDGRVCISRYKCVQDWIFEGPYLMIRDIFRSHLHLSMHFLLNWVRIFTLRFASNELTKLSYKLQPAFKLAFKIFLGAWNSHCLCTSLNINNASIYLKLNNSNQMLVNCESLFIWKFRKNHASFEIYAECVRCGPFNIF